MRLALALLFALVLRAPAGELWVAVGEAGLRLTSLDGRTWQNEQRWEHGEDPLCAVAYGLGRFIAVGGTETAGHLLTSTDGRAWRKLPAAARKISAIAFGRDRFVAAQGAQLLVSTDGQTFTPGDRLVTRTPPQTVQIACGDTEAGFRFVLIGQCESADGAAPETWRAVTTDGTRIDSLTPQPPASGIAYGAGHFVVAGRERLESSHDGENWNVQACPGDLFSTVIWTGTRFLASTADAFWTSPDALTWRREKSPAARPLLWARQPAAPLALGLDSSGAMCGSGDFLQWEVLHLEGRRVRGVAVGMEPK